MGLTALLRSTSIANIIKGTTRDNTNKNLGSAPTPGAGGAGGASPGGEKQSIADKLKSGLHLGGHKDT